MDKKAAAYIGIAGAFTMAVSDVILLGQPVSGSEYDIASLEAMANVDYLRAAVGTIEGLFAAFFICFGFWYVKSIFETVNKTLSLWLFVAFCSVFFFGGAFHAAYYFIASPPLDADGLSLIADEALNNFRIHLQTLSWLAVPGFLIGTVLFFKLASDGRFPIWYRFCNPLVLALIFLAMFWFLPAPYGGFLKPAFVNLAFLTFFAFSLKAAKGN